MASEAMMTSKLLNGLKCENWLQIWNYWPQIPWYPCACWLKQLFTVMASEAKAASTWPQRPPPVMALENYISFILPDISYMSIKHEKEKNLSCLKWGLNQGPFGSKSNTLTIMPQGWKQFGSSNFEVVLIRSVFGLLWPHNDLRGHIWPHIWIQWPQNPLMLWFSGL